MEIHSKKFYRVKEISELLRVSERTIRRYCKQKLFPNSFRMEKQWLIPGSDIKDLLGKSS